MAIPAKKNRGFDPSTFLATIGDGRKSLVVSRKRGIFTQGDPADAVFYIQSGEIKLVVVSENGKDGVIAMLGPVTVTGVGGAPMRDADLALISVCPVPFPIGMPMGDTAAIDLSADLHVT